MGFESRGGIAKRFEKPKTNKTQKAKTLKIQFDAPSYVSSSHRSSSRQVFNPHIASCAFKQSSRELWSSASCSYSLACVKLSCVSRIVQFDSQAAVHRSQLAAQRSCAAIDHSRQRLMHLADCRYMHGCIIIHHVCSRSRALCLSQLSRTLSKLLGASRSTLSAVADFEPCRATTSTTTSWNPKDSEWEVSSFKLFVGVVRTTTRNRSSRRRFSRSLASSRDRAIK